MLDAKWTRRIFQSALPLVLMACLVFIPSSLSFAQDPAWDCLDEKSQYKVVINYEEQYSIWPVDREVPAGWEEAGKEGTKQECLDYIEEVWTDMQPLSLRKTIEMLGDESKIDLEKVANLDINTAEKWVSYLEWMILVGEMYLQEYPEIGKNFLSQIQKGDLGENQRAFNYRLGRRSGRQNQ